LRSYLVRAFPFDFAKELTEKAADLREGVVSLV